MVKVFIAASNSDIVACFAVSVGAHPFALRSAAIVRLVLTLLSCIARGRLSASISADPSSFFLQLLLGL